MFLGLEASEACLRAATTSKIRTSHLFTLKDGPSGGEVNSGEVNSGEVNSREVNNGEVNRREETEMPPMDDVLTTDKDLADLEVHNEGDIHEKPKPSDHYVTAVSDGKRIGDEDVGQDVD
jgi:hypothetical protein